MVPDCKEISHEKPQYLAERRLNKIQHLFELGVPRYAWYNTHPRVLQRSPVIAISVVTEIVQKISLTRGFGCSVNSSVRRSISWLSCFLFLWMSYAKTNFCAENVEQIKIHEQSVRTRKKKPVQCVVTVILFQRLNGKNKATRVLTLMTSYMSDWQLPVYSDSFLHVTDIVQGKGKEWIHFGISIVRAARKIMLMTMSERDSFSLVWFGLVRFGFMLYQAIQFRISLFCLHRVKCQKQFYFKQFSLAYKNCSISSNSVLHQYAVLMSKQFSLKQFRLA